MLRPARRININWWMLSNDFGSGYIIVIIHRVGMWMIFISFIELKNTT